MDERQGPVTLNRLAGGLLWLDTEVDDFAPANDTGGPRDIFRELQEWAHQEMCRALLGSP